MDKTNATILSSIILIIILFAYIIPVSHIFALEDFNGINGILSEKVQNVLSPAQSSDKNTEDAVTNNIKTDSTDAEKSAASASSQSSSDKPPSKIRGLSIKAVSSTELKLKWSSSKESDFNHYNVYRGEKSSFSVKVGQTVPSGTTATNSYSLTNLKPNTKYYVKVAAADNAGNIGPLSSTKSAKTKASSTGSTNSPLKKVTSLKVTSASSSQLKLKWSAVKGADHYNIYTSTSSRFSVTLGSTTPTGTSTTTSYSLTGLKSSTTYYVKVAAANSAAIGPLSSTKSGKTKSDGSVGGNGDTTPPGQVTGLSVSTVSSSQLNLGWTKNTASDLDHYNIYRGTSSGFSVTPGSTTPTGTSTTNSYSNTGLSPSTKYYYKVAAVDKAGNVGPLSSEGSGTTGSSGNGNMYDDFESGTYVISDGQKSPNGKWLNRYTSYGQMGVKTENGNNIFYEYPKASTQSGETHSSLALSTQKFSNAVIEFDMRTDKQLRQNSPPNTWEAAWVMWRFVDDFHHYYFVLKTNGIEFGKKDTSCHCEEQVFLKTENSPKLQLSSWAHLKISSIGKHTTIWVNEAQVVDMDDPSYSSTSDMSSGSIGLYNEDASVAFDKVSISPQ
ncbi:MAG TPA: fibronectin type III domain-containing protein [Nitrososphaeraceae archaeon]